MNKPIDVTSRKRKIRLSLSVFLKKRQLARIETTNGMKQIKMMSRYGHVDERKRMTDEIEICFFSSTLVIA